MFFLLRYPYFYYKVLFMTYRRSCLERTACVDLAATPGAGPSRHDGPVPAQAVTISPTVPRCYTDR